MGLEYCALFDRPTETHEMNKRWFDAKRELHV